MPNKNLKSIMQCLVFMFSLMISCKIFSQTKSISSLQIGSKVPEIEFTFPDKTQKKLSEYNGKLVILDFWATWCGSCLASFSKMNTLQKEFSDKIQILLINCNDTRDNLQKVSSFLQKWKERNPSFELASAINDSIAKQYFPHTSIPHYVWISPDGILKAITSSQEITEENILKAVSNFESLKMTLKADFDENKILQLPNEDKFQIDSLMHYSVFMKGMLDDLSRVNQPRKINNKLRGHAMRNISLLKMYTIVAKSINSDLDYYNKRFILNITDSSKLIFDNTQQNEQIWNKENLYTYDLIVPANKSDSVYSYILDDLNKYSNYTGKIEWRSVKCLSLSRISEYDKIKTKGGNSEYKIYQDEKKKIMTNYPLQLLISKFRELKSITLPILDETNYSENVDLELNANLEDLSSIRKALQVYGLDLKETYRQLPMFVITEKNPK